MSVTSGFDPATDGWFFENWGHTGDIPWSLYRETYLGVNPNQDPIEAPLDCAFYELFKGCANGGHCGGMSLLALAVFKFGGHMGFCSPSSFFTGTVGCDRADLHEAIDIVQARQFSAPGIQHFISVVEAGQVNDAEQACAQAKAHIGDNDYAVLSISTSALGEAAHTVIPYEVDETPSGYPPGTEIMYVWDPNFPYDTCPNYYEGRHNRLVVHGPFDWAYRQGEGHTHESDPPSRVYEGPNAWCFAIPMSLVLHKARQPMTVDMVIDALTTIFITGSGAAVTQIEDEDGHRFYASDAGTHVHRRDIETGSPWRLSGAVRWPWYGRSQGALPGELYFLRRPVGGKPLTVTVTGGDYKLMKAVGGNLVEIETRATKPGRDKIRIAGLGTASQSVEINADSDGRTFVVRQLRVLANGSDWRSVQVQGARASRGNLTIQTVGDLQTAAVSAQEGKVAFSVGLQQYRGGKLLARAIGRRTVSSGKVLRLAPTDWNGLVDTRIEAKMLHLG